MVAFNFSLYFAVDDLQSRFKQAEQAIKQLTEGADSVRLTVATKKYVHAAEEGAHADDHIRLLDDAEACLRRSQDLFHQISNGATRLDGVVLTLAQGFTANSPQVLCKNLM